MIGEDVRETIENVRRCDVWHEKNSYNIIGVIILC